MAERPHSLARIFKATAKVEPYEIRAVTIAFVYGFFLLGSYFILRPVRDAMGTIYGTQSLQNLWLVTFLGTLALPPVYALAANRIKRSTRPPCVSGLTVFTLLDSYL